MKYQILFNVDQENQTFTIDISEEEATIPFDDILDIFQALIKDHIKRVAKRRPENGVI